MGYGARFVGECAEAVAQAAISATGRLWEEAQPLPASRFLGIDEFATRKGHRYETILCDLEQRLVLDVSPGRTIEEVVPLLRRLASPETVEAVSMDMSASFRPAVKLALPNATIVVDHFHVIQHVMRAFRKVISSWAHKKEGTILLHRKQHLFLWAKEELSPEQETERARIVHHLPQLQAAWLLKEALRSWYATATAQTAPDLLDQWTAQVEASDSPPLCKALSAFKHWRQEILAFFQFRPSA